jgi:hypothetical protein
MEFILNSELLSLALGNHGPQASKNENKNDITRAYRK